MRVDDIEGTRPRPLYTGTVRDTCLNVSDIAVQHTEAAEIRPRTIDYMMLSSDVAINDPKPWERRPEGCNPLAPRYQWKQAEKAPPGNTQTCKSAMLRRDQVRYGDLSLRTDDITEGDRARHSRLQGELRKAAKDTQSCTDIEGAQAMHTFNRMTEKCQKYYGKALHDPSLRDKDYAFLCGARTQKAAPPIYSADYIGLRRNAPGGGSFGIKKSMMDETFENPMKKLDSTAFVPAHPQAPSLESKYEVRLDTDEYKKNQAKNPHAIPPAKKCPQDQITRNSLMGRMAGTDEGSAQYRFATEITGLVPGPSRKTLLDNAKQNPGRKKADGIGTWKREVERVGGPLETYDRSHYDEFQKVQTLRSCTGASAFEPRLTAPVTRSASLSLRYGNKDGGSLRASGSKSLARTTHQTDEIRLVRDLPAY